MLESGVGMFYLVIGFAYAVGTVPSLASTEAKKRSVVVYPVISGLFTALAAGSNAILGHGVTWTSPSIWAPALLSIGALSGAAWLWKQLSNGRKPAKQTA